MSVTRPMIMGRHGVAASSHYLATAVGLRILQNGGNAVDAGVAMGFALAVLRPQDNGIGGEVPMLIYSAERGRVFAISGQGTAPAAMTVERMQAEGVHMIPGDGLLPAVVPSQVATYITALAEFGTLPLAAALQPAIDLADEGFAMYPELHTAIAGLSGRFRREWPGSVAVYLPEGRAPEVGEVFRQPNWAQTFRRLIEAERSAESAGRGAGLDAARDAFYRGEIADEMARFAAETEVMDASGTAHTGLLTREDLANYAAAIEEPVTVTYRGVEVYKCGPWSQGPVFLQQLRLLEGFDRKKMEHNSAAYIHTIAEASKLAFADRDAYYGDPNFDAIPLDRLLSKEYADKRRALIDAEAASTEHRPGLGDWTPAQAAPASTDTVHLDAVDAQGNLISATPSGGWIASSPVIPALGFPLGTRGQMFSLDPAHPNCLQPGKRPRTTLSPSLVLKEGRPFLAFGTPGGDNQDQWTLQFFLNVIEFGMDLQEAIDAPTFHCDHLEPSFYPRTLRTGRLCLERRIPGKVRTQLKDLGHAITVDDDWSHGLVTAVACDLERGVLSGAASPRGLSYAAGW